jgi:hypothetical protein
VLQAEYALNTHSPPATLADALAKMTALEHSDQTNLRPYVLAARLAIALDRPDEAVSHLETVNTLNPHHKVAQALLAGLRSSDLTGLPDPGQ